MLDFGHLPKPLTGTIDYFPGFSAVTGAVWEVWNKPRGCNFIRILCIGAGGGGGGGGAANGGSTSATSGGGGGSGSISYLTIPAVFLPDRLYVSAGSGGDGGPSNTAGNSGAATEVCIAPANVNIYIVCAANSATGGTGGGGGGGGGTGGAALTLSTCLQGFQGHYNSIAGQNGAAGNAGTGGSITYPTTGLLLSGGSGGGGISINTSFSAGNVTAPASQTSIYNLFQTLTAVAFADGQAGVELYQPLMSCGGVGGAGGLGGGFKGGNGGFGSGGGGGGSAVTSGTLGGRGGDGGDGLVVIQTW